VFRGIVATSLVSLALIGCSAQGLSPSHSVDAANRTPQAIHVAGGFVDQSTAILRWNPTFVKMTDGGPYQATSLTYTQGDTVVVNYDQPCDYHIDYDLHKGPIKHHVETDIYAFYAYSGISGSPPYHCKVHGLLKDTHGHVVARADLAVTITYPKKHGHGG
jgi:hypothetical protein